MKQVFVVYETDAWHTIANRDCKGIYTSKRSAINAIVKNHEIRFLRMIGRKEHQDVCLKPRQNELSEKNWK